MAPQVAATTTNQNPNTESSDSSEDSGWGGALLGALTGMAAAIGAGGDTEAIVSATTQGAAAFSDNQVVQALAQASASTLGQSVPSLGGIAASSGGKSGASFPTKPNLATGACSGFNESNYRQLAVSGGADSQLYAMCGQAFEYYTMYKRAISQGYSEADCNRTYAAHEQASRVASNFANGG